MERSELAGLLTRALGLALAGVALAAIVVHVPSARMLSHVNGIHLLLADLLTRGVFYPQVPTAELAYGTFYQPLAFAPVALLPGSGLEKVPWLRILCAADVLACLGLLAAVAARVNLRSWLAWRPSAIALCTAPVGFCLLAMRDDPRGVWIGILAMLVHLGGGRSATMLAALLLSAAFFTKLTAPFAPFCAIAFDLGRNGRAPLMRFVLATSVACGVPFAILQWGLHVDLLDNGIRLALLEPAYTPRDALHTTWRMFRDMLAVPERSFALIPIAATSLVVLVGRAARRHFEWLDALALAGFAKSWLAYRNPGADYNHLFDLTLFTALHVGVRACEWLTPLRTLLGFLALLALGRPWELLLMGDRPPLHQASAARVAQTLATLPPVQTLVEDPLVQLLAKTTPCVPDCGVVFGRLRRHPEVRATWFGSGATKGTIERMVLLFDPFENTEQRPGPYWYGVVNFDREFYAELVAHWHVVLASADAAILERRP